MPLIGLNFAGNYYRKLPWRVGDATLKQGYEGDVILILATSDLLEARLIQQQ